MLDPNLVSKSAASFGLAANDLTLHRYSQNHVYSLVGESKNVLMRISPGLEDGRDSILAELHWISFLSGQDVNVCAPIYSTRKNPLETVEHCGELFYVTAFEMVLGRSLSREDLTPKLFREMGRLMGTLHNLTKNYTPNINSIQREQWHESRIFHGDLIEQLSRHHIGTFNILTTLLEKLKALPVTNETFGLIHSDIQFHNLLLTSDGLSLYSFENCEYGYFAADIASTLYGCAFNWLRRRHAEDDNVFSGSLLKTFSTLYLKNFWAGYCTENTLEVEWLEHVPDFLTLREIMGYINQLTHVNNSDTEEVDESYLDSLEEMRSQIESGICPLEIDFREFS